MLADELSSPIESLREGLRERGYVEGNNLRFEYRMAEGQNERHAALAAELVALPVDVIVTWGTPAALAAATSTIPIVMGAIGDPVRVGVVSNLARPGANITGFAALTFEMEEKRLELLKELLSGQLARVAVLTTTNLASPLVLESMPVRCARRVCKWHGLVCHIDEIAVHSEAHWMRTARLKWRTGDRA